MPVIKNGFPLTSSVNPLVASLMLTLTTCEEQKFDISNQKTKKGKYFLIQRALIQHKLVFKYLHVNNHSQQKANPFPRLITKNFSLISFYKFVSVINILLLFSKQNNFHILVFY